MSSRERLVRARLRVRDVGLRVPFMKRRSNSFVKGIIGEDRQFGVAIAFRRGRSQSRASRSPY